MRNALSVFDRQLSDPWKWFDEIEKSLATREREAYLPSTDLVENDKEFRLHMDLPGVKEDDINIEIDAGRLNIQATRHAEFESKEGVHRVERRYGSFARSFTIPQETIKIDEVEADFRDGVLTLVLPKKDEIKPRKVAIKPGNVLKSLKKKDEKK